MNLENSKVGIRRKVKYFFIKYVEVKIVDGQGGVKKDQLMVMSLYEMRVIIVLFYFKQSDYWW